MQLSQEPLRAADMDGTTSAPIATNGVPGTGAFTAISTVVEMPQRVSQWLALRAVSQSSKVSQWGCRQGRQRSARQGSNRGAFEAIEQKHYFVPFGNALKLCQHLPRANPSLHRTANGGRHWLASASAVAPLSAR